MLTEEQRKESVEKLEVFLKDANVKSSAIFLADGKIKTKDGEQKVGKVVFYFNKLEGAIYPHIVMDLLSAQNRVICGLRFIQPENFGDETEKFEKNFEAKPNAFYSTENLKDVCKAFKVGKFDISFYNATLEDMKKHKEDIEKDIQEIEKFIKENS